MANFETTGILAAAQNQRNGVPLKFSLPPDSTAADSTWKLFEFRQGQDDPVSERLLKSHCAWLFGKDRKLEDRPTDPEDAQLSFIPLNHPSVSRQHLLLVFRRKTPVKIVPYLLDLGSSNGSFLNGEKMAAGKLTEILDKDVFKIGESSREWVMMLNR